MGQINIHTYEYPKESASRSNPSGNNKQIYSTSMFVCALIHVSLVDELIIH